MQKETWLITGVSSGLGKALTEKVLQQGHYVIGTFRNKLQAEHFNKTHGSQAEAHVLDLRNDSEIERFLKTIQQTHSKIDVLVNNAGFGLAGAIEECSLHEVQEVFEVHLFAVWKLLQGVLPIIRPLKKGRILQISSHGGVKAFPGFGAYNASKFALEGMSEALSVELAPLGLQVTLVEPGPFRTGFAARGFKLASRQIEDYNATAGTFRKNIKAVDGKQEGDPEKAATALWELTRMDQAPMRLVLGKIALQTVQSKIASLQKDLEASKETAHSVVF